MSQAISSCTSCGACCAHYRVSFYWSEAIETGLAEDLYEALTPTMACMKGTHSKSPRCIALQGQIGQSVHCTVYPHRTTPCREVQVGDDKCLQARQAHQLGHLPR